MKKFLIGLLCVAGVAYLLGVGILVVRTSVAPATVPNQSILGDVNGVPFTSIDVASSTSVLTAASKQVLATSTSAQWRMFQNNSACSIYLAFTKDVAATANTGVYLAASTTLVFTNESLYQGAVQAIATGCQGTLLISQK